jgi:hypothetical protein
VVSGPTVVFVQTCDDCALPEPRLPATGTFIGGKGKQWEVDACDEHAEEGDRPV